MRRTFKTGILRCIVWVLNICHSTTGLQKRYRVERAFVFVVCLLYFFYVKHAVFSCFVVDCARWDKIPSRPVAVTQGYIRLKHWR